MKFLLLIILTGGVIAFHGGAFLGSLLYGLLVSLGLLPFLYWKEVAIGAELLLIVGLSWWITRWRMDRQLIFWQVFSISAWVFSRFLRFFIVIIGLRLFDGFKDLWDIKTSVLISLVGVICCLLREARITAREDLLLKKSRKKENVYIQEVVYSVKWLEEAAKDVGGKKVAGASRTVGVIGDWGAGKTTFLRQLEDYLNQRLEEHKMGKKSDSKILIPVFFDAWKWQSASSPEFALLECIYHNYAVRKFAWHKKPLVLWWARIIRNLSFSIQGVQMNSSGKNREESKSAHPYSLALLAREYDWLLKWLKMNDANLVILIDEADRCERTYTQSILSLLPRYLNKDNCFAYFSLVKAQIEGRLFSPLSNVGEQDIGNSGSASSPESRREVKEIIEPRYQLDLWDTLSIARNSYRGDGSGDGSFRFHSFAKFFESYVMMSPLDAHGRKRDLLHLLSQSCSECFGCEKCFLSGFNIDPTEEDIQKEDSISQNIRGHINSILKLCSSRNGMSGNPRAINLVLRTTLSALRRAMGAEEYLLDRPCRFSQNKFNINSGIGGDNPKGNKIKYEDIEIFKTDLNDLIEEYKKSQVSVDKEEITKQILNLGRTLEQEGIPEGSKEGYRKLIQLYRKKDVPGVKEMLTSIEKCLYQEDDFWALLRASLGMYWYSILQPSYFYLLSGNDVKRAFTGIVEMTNKDS